MLHVCRKDDPKNERTASPDSEGFRKYYYSQPMPDGGQDNDKLEELFGEYESQWPEMVRRLRAGENVNDRIDYLYAFIGLQRARVPAARDACEKLLAELVKAFGRRMEANGELPPAPQGLEELCAIKNLDVAIDPHQSIHAMVSVMRGTGELRQHMGLALLHNRTDVPFLTSDNPVIWYDPMVAENQMRPYDVHIPGPVLLLFPITPDMLIIGDSGMKEHFSRHGLSYSEPQDSEAVETMNRQICRFAYEHVYASQPGLSEHVDPVADVSPVLKTETISAADGEYLHHQMVWGKRERKPKWQPKKQ